jgi:hypothetical protein
MNNMLENSGFTHLRILALGALLLFSAGASAQQPDSQQAKPQSKEAQQAPKKNGKKAKKSDPKADENPKPGQASTPSPAKNISDAWSELLQDTIPKLPAGQTVGVAQNAVEKRAGGDFLDHFFYETRTEYSRTNTYFSGQPTATGVINAAPTGSFNPSGIPDPADFQPSANEMYSFMNWGTRGWLSPRINTSFSFRYHSDLTHVDQGAPAQDFTNTFTGNRLYELMSGYVEINGLPTDGILAGTSLRVGRQDVYGAELATLDGASFTAIRRKYSFAIFGGRRFTYFSDPVQRAMGGANFTYRISDDSSFEYDGLLYIKGSQVFTYRRRMPRFLFNTHLKMIGGYPIDYVANGIWTPADGKTTVSLGFTQKITDKDFFYDYTNNATDLDPHNPLFRLNLGPLSPYSQVVVEARRSFTRRINLGGGVWIRRLTESKNQGPFDTSFQDYRLDAQFFPVRDIKTFFEYHERDSDRLSPFPSTTFDDITAAGETRIQDFTLELGRDFEKGRISLRGGGYYRLMNFQDRFLFLNHLHNDGLLGRVQFKVDQRTRMFFDYSLDSDFFAFAPSIRNAQILRLGMDWKY